MPQELRAQTERQRERERGNEREKLLPAPWIDHHPVPPHLLIPHFFFISIEEANIQAPHASPSWAQWVPLWVTHRCGYHVPSFCVQNKKGTHTKQMRKRLMYSKAPYLQWKKTCLHVASNLLCTSVWLGQAEADTNASDRQQLLPCLLNYALWEITFNAMSLSLATGPYSAY